MERPSLPPRGKRQKTDDSAAIVDKVKAYENSFYLWTPTDDFLLKEGMQTMGDYQMIAKNIRFAHNFCAEEIEARWLALLYHPVYAHEAATRLPSVLKASEQAPWTEGEEEILRESLLRSTDVDFQALLEKHRTQFHSSRTARALQAHSDILKRLHRLGTDEFISTPQEPSPLPVDVPSLPARVTSRTSYFPVAGMAAEEIEEKGARGEGMPFPLVEYVEMRTINERKKARVSYLRKVMKDKEDIEKIELIMNRAATWGDAFALLRGVRMRSYLNKQKVVVGRKTSSFTPDIDLSEEGYAKGISRRHAEITTQSPTGRFSIENVGKLAFYVNGQALLPGTACVLAHYSFLEIGNLKFIFEINLGLFARGVDLEEIEETPMHKEEVNPTPKSAPSVTPPVAAQPTVVQSQEVKKQESTQVSKPTPASTTSISVPSGQMATMMVDSEALSRTPVISSVISSSLPDN